MSLHRGYDLGLEFKSTCECRFHKVNVTQSPLEKFLCLWPDYSNDMFAWTSKFYPFIRNRNYSHPIPENVHSGWLRSFLASFLSESMERYDWVFKTLKINLKKLCGRRYEKVFSGINSTVKSYCRIVSMFFGGSIPLLPKKLSRWSRLSLISCTNFSALMPCFLCIIIIPLLNH